MDSGLPLNILIVEDDEALCDNLSDILEMENYLIRIAGNADEAFSEMDKNTFPIILLDLRLPGHSGITMLKRIKKLYPETQVIIMTAYASTETAIDALQHDAFAYLIKPVNIKELVIIIDRAFKDADIKKEKEFLFQELNVANEKMRVKNRELGMKNEHLIKVLDDLDNKKSTMSQYVEKLEKVVDLVYLLYPFDNIEENIIEMTATLNDIFNNLKGWGILHQFEDKYRLHILINEKLYGSMKEKLIDMVIDDYFRSSHVFLSSRDLLVNCQVEKQLVASGSLKGYRSYPLQRRGKRNGLIFIIFEKELKDTTTDQQLLQLIAGHLSSSLENAELFREIEKRRKELKELSDFKDEILSIAAHDLRTPMAVLDINLNLLRNYFEKMSQEERNNALDDNLRKSGKIIDMLNSILDLSVIESGKLILRKRKGNLGAVLRESLKMAIPLSRSKDIEIKYYIPDSLPLIEFDPDKIQQVFDNLISNAIKYTHRGGKISISMKGLNGLVQVNVRDNGVGIKESEIKKVFRKFSKTSSKPTAGERSFGLGLAITKNILELHNGSIWVESEGSGKGACFSFQIPLREG